MSKIRITKEFSFEMAHVLEGYDGACSQIHGHSYRLFVTAIGSPIDDPTDPKYGMVMDFRQLRGIVDKLILSRYDHALMVRRSEGNSALVDMLKERYERIIEVDYQPTCENMVSRFAAAISAELPERVKLFSIKLHETATSFAEWYAQDNG